ncbi:MAG: deoxyribodipyrimidine photo-lyase [Saprospiraceae bacterium]|nr:deoxyribodipyrimidine photo-lyase [Saprospiraceae bacterium]
MGIHFFWFRRDLRLHDNAALYHALRSGNPVVPVFIFDKNILDKLQNPRDARVTFIHDTLTGLQTSLQKMGSDLRVFYGTPEEIWPALIEKYAPSAIYCNHDYESYAISRDERIHRIAAAAGVAFHSFKDHVIFEKREVCKDDGMPYTVFTPYKRKWLQKIQEGVQKVEDSFYLKPYPVEKYIAHFFKTDKPQPVPALESMGFERSDIIAPPKDVERSIIRNYHETRNFPALHGTSRLGIHFRFGTISIRDKARKAFSLNETYLSELIWRDFYAQILSNFPYVEKSAFRPEYDRIQWRNDEKDFEKWCEGKTGYPIVDAGMRELVNTGYMHNRVRMITASFLTKHLLIDWRWGEAWFARHLLDFDLASNNGGWQWAAGCGTDAAPYFRIFNPDAQTEKFDHQLQYIKKWIPELGTAAYPKPIVDHKLARERCLTVYKQALDGK